jgi:hypothetical protein
LRSKLRKTTKIINLKLKRTLIQKQKWNPPPPNCYKVNNLSEEGIWGLGEVVAASTWRTNEIEDAIMAESHAHWSTHIFAIGIGLKNILLIKKL